MWWFMLKCQDIDQSTEEGQCECQITYLHRDLSNFLGQPQNNRVTRGLDPDTFSAGPLHALTPLLSVDVVQSFRIEETVTSSRDTWRGHLTRDEDTWRGHVTMSAGELHPRFLLSKRFPVHAAVELQDLATLHRLLSDQLGTEHLAWKNIRAATSSFTITKKALLGPSPFTFKTLLRHNAKMMLTHSK